MRENLRARLHRIVLAIALLLGPAGCMAAPLVLLVTDSGLPDDAPRALQTHLVATLPTTRVEIRTREELARTPLPARPDAAVSFGAAAAAALREHLRETPQLHLLLTREAYAALPPSAAAESAIFIEQPATRQIALLQRALPGWPVAIAASPASAALAQTLTAAAGASGIRSEVLQINTSAEWHTALEQLLREPAILVALPDPTLYNSHTIRNVLLASYRHRSPLAGFSPAYLRAGALITLYTTPEQLARQAGRTLAHMLHGTPPPPADYSSEIEVGINPHVARSLGITTDAPERIADDVLATERRITP